MKKHPFLTATALICVTFLTLAGCGGGGGSSGSSSSSSSSSSSDTNTFSGTINIAAAQSANAKDGGFSAMAATPASSYIVAAVNYETNKIYKGVAGSDGSFSFSVPSSSAKYMLQILNSSGKFVGPMVADDGLASNQKLIGITSSGESLGTITVPNDTSTGPITTSATLTTDGDLYAHADSSTGVPKGQFKGGKGDQAKLSGGSADTTVIDGDRDGVVDMFDADNNGEGIPDDLDDNEGRRDAEGLASDTGISSIGVIMNLKVTNDTPKETMYTGTQTAKDTVIAETQNISLNISPKAGYTISSIVASAGASWRSTARVNSAANPNDVNWGNLVTWSDTSNVAGEAYGFDCSSGNQCEITIWPGAVLSTGDTLFLDVTYSDSTTETIVWSVSFGFADIPKLVAFKDGTPADLSDFTTFDPTSGANDGTRLQPIQHTSGNDLWLKFAPPKDENGDFLWEQSINHYKFEMFPQGTNGQLSGITSGSWNANGGFNIPLLDHQTTPPGLSALNLTGVDYTSNMTMEADGSALATGSNIQPGNVALDGEPAIRWEVQNDDLSYYTEQFVTDQTTQESSIKVEDSTSTSITDNYYVIVLPSDIFDESLTDGSTNYTVECWDFDIAAQKNSSNAAIKLYVEVAGTGGCSN